MSLFIPLIDIGFMTIRIWDVLDWLIVAFLLFNVYRLLKGTIAFNIFLGAIILYIIWRVVDVMEMTLLSLILGNFVSVGVLLLIIIFQPEVRRFLLFIGNTTLKGRSNFLNTFLSKNFRKSVGVSSSLQPIATAVFNLSKDKTGALIIISNDLNASELSKTGVAINAELSAPLLESIFNKSSPLHDGAVVISGGQIEAASCILPISENTQIPRQLGLRHRAGIGVTEANQATAIILSEETGKIAVAKEGKIETDISHNRLIEILQTEKN